MYFDAFPGDNRHNFSNSHHKNLTAELDWQVKGIRGVYFDAFPGDIFITCLFSNSHRKNLTAKLDWQVKGRIGVYFDPIQMDTFTHK